MYQHLTRRFFADNFGNMYALCRWSRIWAEAEIAQSRTAAERQSAAQAHLERIGRVHKHAVDRANRKISFRAEPFGADYYLADAEVFLAQTKDGTLGEDALAAARRRANAACQIYEIDRKESIEDKYFLGNALWWSGVWKDAEFAVNPTKAGQLATAKAYLERTLQLEDMAKKAFENPSDTILAAAWYHADAEILVFQVQTDGGQPLPLKPAKARVDAAKASYESYWKDYLAGPGFEGAIYEWSKKWRNAALALAKTQAEKIAINEAHLKRMRELDQLEVKKVPGGLLDGANVTEYYIAEAETLLSKAKGDRPPP
jgi:hypothetical protein